MSPASFFAHSLKIYQDEDTAKQYRLNRYVGGPKGQKGEPITYDAMRRLYCQTVVNDYDESQFCNDEDTFDLYHDNAVMTLIGLIDRHWFKKGKAYKKINKSTI